MAVRTISTKLAIEGEGQYKLSIAACNAELKTLKSSLELVESEFKGNANSMEALTAKGKALAQMQAEQEKKVQTLSDALKNAQSHQKAYADAAEEAGKMAAEYEVKLEKLKQSTGDTQQEQAELTAEVEKWKHIQEEAEQANAAATRGVQSWQQQLNSAKVEQNNLSEAAQKNSQYLEEAANSADGCAKSIDEYGKEVKQAAEDSQEMGDKSKAAIDQLATALAAAGVANTVKEIAEALRECVDTFADFDAQMSNVQALSGATSGEMEALSEKAKEMGSTTAFTAKQAGEAFEYMAMAGWKSSDMIAGIEGIMNLAAASGEDLATTSDIVTDALTAFGLTAEDSGHFADVLAVAATNANTNVGMMGETFKYVAPVAGSLGYSVDDAAAAIGIMANSGIKASQAGTSLRSIITRLSTDAGASSTKLGALGVLTEQLGVAFYNADGSARELNEVLNDSRAAWGGLSEEQQISYAKTIAGQEAMSGWLALMNASEEDIRKLTVSIEGCSGAAEKMAQIRLDNLAGQITLFESAADGLKLAVGEQLAPALKAVYSAGTTAFTWATDFVEKNPWIVGAVAGLTAALGALSVGVAAVSAAPAIIHALNVALGALVANPVVAVTAAVVGLGVAVGTWVASAMEADESTKAFMESMQESKAAYEELSAAMEGQQASTAASLAALEELLAAEDKSAAQKQIIAEKVAELNEAVPNLGLAYDAASDSINMTTDALEHLVEKAGEQEEYEAQVARLSELYTEQKQIAAELEAAQAALNEARETGSGNVLTLQNNIDALTEAQEANAEEIAALEEASREYGERQAEAAEKTEKMTARIESLTSEMDTLQAAYQDSYDKAMESIEGQMGLFEEMDGSAKTSIGSLIDTLKGQVEYMETYSENIKRAMEMGVDEGLVKKLSDGSEESAQILAAIVQGGEEDIRALNEELAKVEEGKANFSDTVAQMETDFNEKMDILVGDLNDAIQEMDLHDDAYDVGYNNMQGLIDGTAEQKKALVDKYTEMGNAALAAYKRAVAQASPSKKFKEAGSYDIQGIIQGAAGEKDKLAAAYGEVAKAAVDSVEENLPSKVLTTSLEESRAACQKLMTTLAGERYAVASSTAALRTLVDVENRSAAQKDAMVKKVAELNKAVPNLGLAYDATTDSINMTTEALEKLVDRAEDQKLYEARVERLSELYTEQEQLSLELEAAREALSQAEAEGSEGVQVLQESIEALTGAQAENAAQIAELEAATADYGESQAEAAAKAQAMTERITALTEEVDKLHTSYEDIRKKAADSMESQLGLFNELDGSAQTSIDSLIDTLRGQVEYMRVYAENIKLAMELGVDQGLVQKLSDGRQESAQILAAIVQGGQQQIDALNNQFARVELGKGYFAKTVADMEVDFKEKMGELVSDLNDAINEMDLHDEAYTIGMNNILGLLNGADSQRQALIDEYTDLAKAANDAYRKESGQHSPSKKFRQIGSYDIQGIIQGAESERARLEAAYTDAAQAALHSMERAMPSTFLEPRNPSPAEQTAAIAAAVRQTADSRPVIQLNIDHMEVRSDADIDNVAQKLYYMVERETRGRGGVL